MRRLFLAALLVLFLTACDGGSSAPGRSDVDVDTPELRAQKAAAGIEPCVPGPGGGTLPDLTLPCLGGGSDVDLSSLTGPLLINLWNSPCEPCRAEMPALQEFHEKHGDTVPLLGIDVTDTYPGAAIDLADMTGATYPQLADPGGEIFSQAELRIAPAFPQFILLDADGEITRASPGGLDSLAEVVDLVESNLGTTL